MPGNTSTHRAAHDDDMDAYKKLCREHAGVIGSRMYNDTTYYETKTHGPHGRVKTTSSPFRRPLVTSQGTGPGASSDTSAYPLLPPTAPPAAAPNTPPRVNTPPITRSASSSLRRRISSPAMRGLTQDNTTMAAVGPVNQPAATGYSQRLAAAPPPPAPTPAPAPRPMVGLKQVKTQSPASSPGASASAPVTRPHKRVFQRVKITRPPNPND